MELRNACLAWPRSFKFREGGWYHTDTSARRVLAPRVRASLCERKVSRAIVAIYIDAGRYRSKRGETTYGSAPPLGFVRSVFWRSWAR